MKACVRCGGELPKGRSFYCRECSRPGVGIPENTTEGLKAAFERAVRGEPVLGNNGHQGKQA